MDANGRKIARVIGVLNKLKHIFPQHILLTIYNSLIQPHLIYGLYLWGLNCKRLKILQKKAVRILAFRPYISHSTSIFKTLKILKLEDLYTMQLYKFYYKKLKTLIIYYHRISIASHHIITMKTIIMTSCIVLVFLMHRKRLIE